MTEEEQKAIENIEKELNKKYQVEPLYKDFSINSPMSIVPKYYNDTDIRIALNLISKLQNQIKELKEEGTKDWEERCNLVYKELNEELDKKDKVIDLMTIILKENDDVRSTEEIKQYFYNKVEETNE